MRQRARFTPSMMMIEAFDNRDKALYQASVV
jgi:hypothetical protein